MPASPSYNRLSYSSAPIADSIMRKASPMPQPLLQPSYGSSATPWQHATNGLTSPQESTPSQGKTSQVLAKLTAECDRLRREINVERTAKEDNLMQLNALKGRVNLLEEKNETLSMQAVSNESALARKERRLDDMKTTLDEGMARRKRAEAREAEMGRKLGEIASQASREISEAHTESKSWETAYKTLQTEYRGLQKRIDGLRREALAQAAHFDERNVAHEKQFTQLEILLDQQRHQQEKSDRQVLEMSDLLLSYRETEDNTKRLETDMQKTVHEMRWVIGVERARLDHSQGQTSYASQAQQPSDRPLRNREPRAVPSHISSASLSREHESKVGSSREQAPRASISQKPSANPSREQESGIDASQLQESGATSSREQKSLPGNTHSPANSIPQPARLQASKSQGPSSATPSSSSPLKSSASKLKRLSQHAVQSIT